MRFILQLCIIIFIFSNSVKSITPQYGVAPEELEFYKDDKVFNCLRSKKQIPFTQVNDDYCDCPDGTDEPGTAACSNHGHFWCTNNGYKGMYISSSFVNDGVCDCCDGSDEYKSTIKCENKCKELGSEMRKKHIEEVERYTNGLKKKKEMEEEGSRIIKDKLVNLDTLKKEIDPIKTEIKELEVLVDRKKSEKEQEEKRLKDEKEAQNQQQQKENQQEQQPQESTTTDENKNDESVNNQNEDEGDSKPTVEEKLTSELLESTTKGNIIENTNTDNNNDDITNNNNKVDDNNNNNNDNNKQDKSILDTIYNFIIPLLPNSFLSYKNMDLNGLESELSKKRESLKQKQDEIEKIEKLLGYDTGVNNVFIPLYGKCFDFKTKEYTYTVCPFDKASQGHTSLGKFDSWKDGHNQMFFDNGQQCWGGPKRSLKVFMECGSDNELYDVNEPGKCEYTIKFRTPAMCTEEHLKVLKLESDHSL